MMDTNTELILRINPLTNLIQMETVEKGIHACKRISYETMLESIKGSLQKDAIHSGLLPTGCLSFQAGAQGRYILSISDSFKRAAVLWGIGRYLYSLEGVWVELKDGKYIVDGEYRKLDTAYEKAVAALTGEAPPKASARQRATAPPESAPSGQQSKAEPKPAIQFDFAVKAATPKNFASGKGFVLSLAPAKKGTEVTAYLQGEHPDIASGVCLKNVQLTQAPGAVAGSIINILASYEIAA